MAAMEEIKVSGGKLKEKLKELIREGNVRRIIIRNPEGRTLLDMPLNAGFAGAALLPFWAAVGSVLLLATDYTIGVERDTSKAIAPINPQTPPPNSPPGTPPETV
ncbi:MAG: DUF4342 domain-containing protein [Gemmatimonas sp.]|jgi:hypothetical protein